MPGGDLSHAHGYGVNSQVDHPAVRRRTPEELAPAAAECGEQPSPSSAHRLPRAQTAGQPDTAGPASVRRRAADRGATARRRGEPLIWRPITDGLGVYRYRGVT